MYLINIVINGKLDHNFFSSLVPNIGDSIKTTRMQRVMVVTSKLIDYQQIDQYQPDDPGRGGEAVFLNVKDL